MILLKRFFRRIIKDFRHKELLPLKLIFFVQASTLYVLYPYLTIHMRELGINVEETAIMSAVTPFVAIVMPPLAGMVADRIGNFKILLSLFSSLGGAAALLLLLVPVGRVTVKFPHRVVMDLSCPGTEGELIYTMSQYHPCVSKSQPNISTRIESCGYVCQVELSNETDQSSLLSSRNYSIRHFDLDQNLNTSYYYNVSANQIPQRNNDADSDDIREHRQMRNNDFYKTSVRKLSKNSYYFPTRRLNEFRCNERPVDVETMENFTTTETTMKKNEMFCEFGDLSTGFEDYELSAYEYTEETVRLRIIESNYIDRLEKKRRFLVEQVTLPMYSNNFVGARCKNPEVESRRVSVNVPLINRTISSEAYKTLNLDGCTRRCVLTGPRSDICTNMETIVEYNVQLTFWAYLGIRVFIGIIGGTAFAMFEGAVIAILREQKADYGLQRIYGSIGGMISSPLSGMLIDYASRGKSYGDYRPAFYLYAALKIASGVLMLSINLEFKAPARNVVSDVVSVLKNVEIVALLLACFVLGTAWGYIESFLFWLLQDLGASRSLMGITITVGGIAGIPLLVLSGPIINKIGHANVLFIGFVFYAVRLLGYSLIYNPWLCLIFEALESVTASLSFTAAVTYAAKLSTTTTDTAIQGLLGGLYYGVGKGSGSLIGGYLMKFFGTRPTYQIFAAMSLVTGIVYFFFNLLYLKKRPQVEGNDIVKKKSKKPPTAEQNGVDKDSKDSKDLAERNEMKKREAQFAGGHENIAFAGNIDDIEAINNARNLDSIDDLTDDVGDEKFLKNNRTEDKTMTKLETEVENSSGIAIVPTEPSTMVGKCKVTVEKQPEDDK